MRPAAPRRGLVPEPRCTTLQSLKYKSRSTKNEPAFSLCSTSMYLFSCPGKDACKIQTESRYRRCGCSASRHREMAVGSACESQSHQRPFHQLQVSLRNSMAPIQTNLKHAWIILGKHLRLRASAKPTIQQCTTCFWNFGEYAMNSQAVIQCPSFSSSPACHVTRFCIEIW